MTTGSGAFHRLTIVPMIAALENLGAILRKAEEHAAQHEIDPSVLLGLRLFPNMFSFIQQLQYSLFLPMDFAQNFSDQPAPKVGYEEASLADVHASLAQAIAYLKSITPGRMDERAQTVVPAFFDPGKGMAAEAYAAGMIMPDFYFHLTVAYAILRHNAVPLGKSDFVGRLSTQPME